MPVSDGATPSSVSATVGAVFADADALVYMRGTVNESPESTNAPRVAALNAGRPVNVSVINVLRCCGNVRPVLVVLESSAARTVRRASSSPSAALMFASRY